MDFKEKGLIELSNQEIADLSDALGPMARVWSGDKRQRAVRLRDKLATILKTETEAPNAEPPFHINEDQMRTE